MAGSWSAIAPVLALLAAAMLILALERPLKPWRGAGRVSEILCLLGLAAAALLLARQWGAEAQATFHGRYLLDRPAVFLQFLFLLIGAGVTLISLPYLAQERLEKAEFLALVLFCVMGMMLMAAAAEMITLFLALELLSMGLYVLAGYRRQDLRSVEAAVKYFLLGAFASAILLMGMALSWGVTGSLALSSLAAAGPAGPGPAGPGGSLLAQAGFWLIVVGLAFKISAVPFHFWTADVYEGSPSPVAAFMTTGTKAAAFAALLRILAGGFAPDAGAWKPVVWWLAVLTMTGGNLMAIVQANIKRMLAFSSVAHAGYLLVALVAGGRGGTRALLFYLVAYTLMSLGAFAVVGLVGRKGEEYQSIYEYAGLARRQPWLAALMAVFLFSLAGIPPTVGFTGKLFIFSEAIGQGFVGLAVIAVLNSLLSVYYYIRVVYLMYMKEEWEKTPDFELPLGAALILAFCFLLVFWLGLFPGELLAAAGYSARFQ